MKLPKRLLILIVLFTASLTSSNAQIFAGLKFGYKTTLNSNATDWIEGKPHYYLTDTNSKRPRIVLGYKETANYYGNNRTQVSKWFTFKAGEGDLQKLSTYGKELGVYLSVDREAYSHFQKFRKTMQAKTFFTVVTFASAIPTFYFLISESENSSLAAVAAICGISFCVAYTLPYFARPPLRKAVKTYNRNAGYGYMDGLEKR